MQQRLDFLLGEWLSAGRMAAGSACLRSLRRVCASRALPPLEQAGASIGCFGLVCGRLWRVGPADRQTRLRLAAAPHHAAATVVGASGAQLGWEEWQSAPRATNAAAIVGRANVDCRRATPSRSCSSSMSSSFDAAAACEVLRVLVGRHEARVAREGLRQRVGPHLWRGSARLGVRPWQH